MTSDYQICSRCVMDTTAPDIRFDGMGVCNYCHEYDEAVIRRVFSGVDGERRLSQIIDRVKREGHGKKYDCIIGLSGGVDSTFVAYKVKRLGLRPLAIHLDNGWDSELAVKNIEQTVKRLEIDLFTYVLDWEEFRDLQASFLKASTPDSEIPSDHAIISALHHAARRNRVRYILAGANVHTESHLPRAWSQGHHDWRYICSIQKQYGTAKLKSFPHMNYVSQVYYGWTHEWIDILNYMDYSKKNALRVLEKEIGWKYYGGKHYESIYTRFYQGYLLPRKFGYDKRKAHLSSLVCSGEMSRADALNALNGPTYDPSIQEEDVNYVIKKLNLTEDEFGRIMSLPKKSYWDYPSYGSLFPERVYRGARWIYRVLKSCIRRD